MSKHSHISAIFDNAFQSRAGSPDAYMSMDLDELTNCYDDVLLRVLNNHAPVRRKLLKVKRSTPWYNPELRQLGPVV